MMKKNYMQVDLRIVAFKVCDVIRTSEEPGFLDDGDNAVPDWS